MSDAAPARVFISYAHDDQQHVDRVRELWLLLRSCGIDAELDLPADERRQDWSLWMLRGIRDSRYALVVASPQYKRRAEGDAAAGEGSGAQWEARLLRRLVYEDPAALDRIVPVVLPGGSPDDLPDWLGGRTGSHYPVEELTVTGAERLLRLLTGQPYETVPELGAVPELPPREPARAQAARAVPSTLPSTSPSALSAPLAAPAPAPLAAPAPVPPPAPPPADFAFPEPKALVDALMAGEVLHRLAGRHELLDLMGEHLGLGHAFSVVESPDARTHLRALVRRSGRTLTPDATLKALYFALAEIAPDDTGTERVRNLLVASGLALGEV